MFGQLFKAENAAMTARLTERDEEILRTLTLSVRCLTAPIAATYFWHGTGDRIEQARRRLNALEKDGWLNSAVRSAKTLPHLTTPLIVWNPGDELPNVGKLSYQLKHRFSSSASLRRIFIATEKAANRYGGIGARWPRNSETSHDLGLAQVYLELKSVRFDVKTQWISEGSLAARGMRSGQKLPDAIVRHRDGHETVIEFGGEYSKAKLTEFHLYCAAKTLRYEIW